MGVAVSANADRPVWYPGKAPAAHLDGSLPGDYGFDPLSLSADPEMRQWMVQAELQHARWAMLGVAGCVAPELLTNIGVRTCRTGSTPPLTNTGPRAGRCSSFKWLCSTGPKFAAGKT